MRSIIAAGLVTIWVGATAGAQQLGDRNAAGLGFFGRSTGYTAPMNLAESRAFPFRSASAWAVPASDFLPDWRPAGWDNNSAVNLSLGWGQPTRAYSATGYSKDSSKEVVEMRKSNLFDYVHGEVGGFFGTSTGGRNSLTSEGGYIHAEVGNENVHIGVGAFYEHSSFDFKRGR